MPSDAPYTGETWPQVEKNYAAMVTRMDGDVGRLLALLKELGLDSNTIVFFTSDNGPCDSACHDIEFFDSNGPLRGVKRDMYEGGIRIPMIARWPGNVPEGRVSDQVWAFWDVAAQPSPNSPAFPRRSTRTASPWRPHSWAANRKNSTNISIGTTATRAASSCRPSAWATGKASASASTRPIELYDLSKDIGETKDVAAAHPDVVARIAAIIDEAYTPSPDYPIKSEG